MAFEVGGPDLVGSGHGGCGAAGVREAPTATRGRDHAVALEDVTDSGAGRPGDRGIVSAQEPQELLGAPVRMATPGLQDPLDDLGGRRTSQMVRPAGSFTEPFGALLLEPADPLVGGLAADAVSAAYFGQGIEFPCAVGNEQESLVHG